MKHRTDTIVIGGGQAGLATSHCLSDLGIDHVVFERGEVAQRWRAERWDSLHLLTPNWMTRLPGFTYTGSDPDGFMHKESVAGFLTEYQHSFSAPVLTNTHVRSVSQTDEGFCVETGNSTWNARSVVIATGACDTPHVPGYASEVHNKIEQITPSEYKSSSQIRPGGVLVVGASATGIQLAHELQNAGHAVTLAAGRHSPTPRSYRGRDIMDWLDQSKVLKTKRHPDVELASLFRNPSFQLVGRKDRADLNIASLLASGGRVTGRLSAASGFDLQFAPDLQSAINSAHQGQEKMLRAIDTWIDQNNITAPPPAPRTAPLSAGNSPATLNLKAEGINTILWATGYKRDYSWLNVPVLNAAGEINQNGGVTNAPGLFTMGLPFMRRCNSTFIDGVAQDARDITGMIAGHLRLPTQRAA